MASGMFYPMMYLNQSPHILLLVKVGFFLQSIACVLSSLIEFCMPWKKHQDDLAKQRAQEMVEEYCERYYVPGITFHKIEQIEKLCVALKPDRMVPSIAKNDRPSILLFRKNVPLMQIITCPCCASIGFDVSIQILE